MKFFYLSFLLVIFIAWSSYAQVKLSLNQIKNSDAISLGKNNKLEISGVNASNKKKFSIKNEAGQAPGKPPAINFDAASQVLSFDFEEMFDDAPNGSFFLHLPDGTKRELDRSGEVHAPDDRTTGDKKNKDKHKAATGIAYWDALAIENLWGEDKLGAKDVIKKYINKYTGKEKDWPEIFENPFFKRSAIIKELAENKAAISQADGSSTQNILGNLGGLDVTKYVQAFADFLRDRIKEELTVAYLQKLRAMIEASEELQYMLPKTRTIFLSNDAFTVPNMGTTYKAAFAEDLENLMPDFEKMVFAFDKYIALRTNDAFIGFMTAWHFADMSAKNYHPADILRILSNRFEVIDNNSPKTAYAINVLNSFSQNLLDTSGKNWIGRNQLRNISEDQVFIFLGLVYEKYTLVFDVKIGSKSLKELLEKLTENKLVDKIYDLLAIVNTIDDRIKNFRESGDKKETVLTYFLNNADALLDLVDYAVSITEIDGLNKTNYYKWKSVIEHSLEAAKAVKENNIGKLGINVISVIDELSPGEQTWKKNLTEFIKFLTDVSNAATSKDIKALLDHYAAPVHSYRIARSYHSSVSLAAYPGVYAGLEFNGSGNTTEGSFGITAPLGFSFNWNTKKESSNSIFISLIDIGAALSYRFNNDTADLPKKIYLGQIFSPGIAGIHGFRNSPMALKYGIQYAPLLRTIKNGSYTYNDAGVWRASIGITVDIPVLILSRKK